MATKSRRGRRGGSTPVRLDSRAELEKMISAEISKMVPSITQGNRTNQPQARTYGLLEALQSASGSQFGISIPMPRNPADDNAFGPSKPLDPEPLDAIDPATGQARPRTWEYPVSWNLPGNGQREVPWQVLRTAASSVDIIRRCIQYRKRVVRQLKWRWTVTEEAIQDAYASDPRAGRENAEQTLREQWMPEITRLTTLWRKPWASNGMNFGQWANALIEEYLVLDASAVYPIRNLAGDVVEFQIVDGSTIKPLLDVTGQRPRRPYAAFQQILYGFPRGEYAAHTEEIENPDGGKLIVPKSGTKTYQAGQLYYYRENVRANSPFGMSAVEQALISARLYLKRQGWMLAEYDDGSTPMVFIAPEANPALAEKFTPIVRREWEDGINDELAGNTRKRHRQKVLPPGWTATQMASVDERYKPEYDLFLIKLLCSHFDVPPSELGFSEAKGLGSTGWAEQQSDVSGRVGLRPDTTVLTDIINELAHDFQGAPPELEFQFLDEDAEDATAEDAVANAQRQRGTITLNDDRRRLGLPTFDFPEADMPILLAGAAPVFLEGLHGQQQQDRQMGLAAQALQAGVGPDGQPITEDSAAGAAAGAENDGGGQEEADTSKAAAVAAEQGAFYRWLAKRANPGRRFRVEHASPADFAPEDWERLDFADWVYVVEADVQKFALADVEKGYEAWWPRDSRGRWIKRGHLSKLPIGPKRREMSGHHEEALDEAVRRVHAGRHFRRGDSALADDLERMGLLEEYGGPGASGNRLELSEAGRQHLEDRHPEDYAEGKAERQERVTSQQRSTRVERMKESSRQGRVERRERDRVRGVEPGYDAYAADGTYLGGAPMQAQAQRIVDEHANPKLKHERAKATIRESVKQRASAQHGGWVDLADVRDDMAARGLSREEQDAALRELVRDPGVRMIPIADRKNLTARDRAAQIELGEGAVPLNAIQIGGDPSYNTAPTVKPGGHDNPSFESAEEELATLERIGRAMFGDSEADWPADRRARVAELRDRVTAADRQGAQHRDLKPQAPAPAAEVPREPRRLTAEELKGLPLSGVSREQFREYAKGKGLTDADVDAELDAMGISRERQPGESPTFSTIYTMDTRAAAEHRQKMIDFTPTAYARLLDEEGRSRVTHKQSREVVEALRAKGWQLTGVTKGTGNTFENGPLQLQMIPGDPPTFYSRGNKLTYKRALDMANTPGADDREEARHQHLAPQAPAVEELDPRLAVPGWRRRAAIAAGKPVPPLREPDRSPIEVQPMTAAEKEAHAQALERQFGSRSGWQREMREEFDAIPVKADESQAAPAAATGSGGKRIADAQHEALMTIARAQSAHANRPDSERRTWAPTLRQMGLTRTSTTSALAKSGLVEKRALMSGDTAHLTPQGHAYLAAQTGDAERARMVERLAEVRAARADLDAQRKDLEGRQRDYLGRDDASVRRQRQYVDEQDRPLYAEENRILRDLEALPVRESAPEREAGEPGGHRDLAPAAAAERTSPEIEDVRAKIIEARGQIRTAADITRNRKLSPQTRLAAEKRMDAAKSTVEFLRRRLKDMGGTEDASGEAAPLAYGWDLMTSTDEAMDAIAHLSAAQARALAKRYNVPIGSRENMAAVKQGLVDVLVAPRIRDGAISRHTTKAGDPDPKADATRASAEPPEVPAEDGRWPAWLVDTLIAVAAADALTSAVAAVLSPAALVAALMAWAAGQARAGVVPDDSAVRQWLDQQQNATRGIEHAIERGLRDAIVEAWAAGDRSAAAVLSHLEAGGDLEPGVIVTADWDGWQPGNIRAARKILSESGDVEAFFADRARMFKRVAANRVDEIAAVLADGLERGESPDSIARALTGVLADRRWAMTTAWTETNAATSAAALDHYATVGVATKGWLNAEDRRVCPSCIGNELAGLIPLGDDFPSGDPHPPAHPRCRCAPIPGPVVDNIAPGETS